jgi:hypothetical protein
MILRNLKVLARRERVPKVEDKDDVPLFYGREITEISMERLRKDMSLIIPIVTHGSRVFLVRKNKRLAAAIIPVELFLEFAEWQLNEAEDDSEIKEPGAE